MTISQGKWYLEEVGTWNEMIQEFYNCGLLERPSSWRRKGRIIKLVRKYIILRSSESYRLQPLVKTVGKKVPIFIPLSLPRRMLLKRNKAALAFKAKPFIFRSIKKRNGCLPSKKLKRKILFTNKKRSF